MIHRQVDAITSRHRLKDPAQRRDIQRYRVEGHDTGRRVPLVIKVRQHQGRFFPGLPVEDGFLELQRIVETAAHVGCYVGLHWVEIQQPQVIGFQHVKLYRLSDCNRHDCQ